MEHTKPESMILTETLVRSVFTLTAMLIVLAALTLAAGRLNAAPSVETGTCEHGDVTWHETVINDETWSITPEIENIWFPVAHTVLCPSENSVNQ